MRIQDISVGLWLEDVARRKFGDYKKSYKKDSILHEVRTEHGIAHVRQCDNSWISEGWNDDKKEFYSKELCDSSELHKIIAELEGK